jgi:putative glutathione S-transferase
MEVPVSGFLDNGQWREGWYDTRASHGEFVRPDLRVPQRGHRDGASGFPAEAGRYRLYVSLACPWAHRTLDRAQAQGPGGRGPGDGGRTGDDAGLGLQRRPARSAARLSLPAPAVCRADPHYTGRVLVPVLWDQQTGTIVSNESSEILRMFNSGFGALAEGDVDLYPAPLREEIDRVNAFVYDNINNGVYRCGFATEQAAYERAFERLFSALDQVEARLAQQPWLVGDAAHRSGLAPVHHAGPLRCGVLRPLQVQPQPLEDFPHLSRYLRALYLVPGIAGTVDIDHIKRHYYMSHPHINPTRIVPAARG